MSLLHAATPYRRDQASQLHVPVVLPLVQVRIGQEGILDVTVDHEPYDGGGPLTREDLHHLLGRIACDLASPVKVEIHELDESIFTDFITPEPQSLTNSQNTIPACDSVLPGEVTGCGFLPDEQVAVAVVVAHQVAKADGTARLRLPAALLAGRPGVVILVGQSSGTIAVSGGAA